MKPVFCFSNSNRAWGGGEKWHLEAALAMAARGASVYLVAGEGTPLYERAQSHARIYTVAGRFSGLDFLNPFTIRRWAHRYHEWGVSSLVLGLPADLKAGGLAARQAGVPRVFYRRGSALPVRDSLLNRYLYGRVISGLIANSRETARLCRAANPALIAPERVHIIYNGLDVAAFDRALAPAAPAFRDPADGADCLYIGNAGRLTTQKGQHFLLHMSRALRDAGCNHRLILAGEGEKAAELAALAQTLECGDTVRFVGFQADMAPFWRSIDCFVLSSLWEGFGYVLAEAMLAEKPVVAFDCNSMPELVESGKTGILLPAPGTDEDPTAVGRRLADAVLAFSRDRDKALSLARAGRDFCRGAFDQERAMDALFALLHPVGGEASHA